jgi:hypothetical protein
VAHSTRLGGYLRRPTAYPWRDPIQRSTPELEHSSIVTGAEEPRVVRSPVDVARNASLVVRGPQPVKRRALRLRNGGHERAASWKKVERKFWVYSILGLQYVPVIHSVREYLP